MRRDTFLKSLAALAAAGSLPLTARAAVAIKMMLPANPGGGWDTTGRALGKALQDAGVASSVTYENKGGAAGAIGLAQFINGSKGDPHALMVMGAVMVGGIITGKPPVNLGQATPIARLTSEYNVFVLPANSPFKTLGDMVAYSQAHPGKLNYGTGGAGTMPHFATVALEGVSGLRATHVPFKGAGEATLALLSGTIDFQIASTPGVMGQVRGGKVRLLAVSGEQRLKALPDVPTFAQAGAPDYKVVNFTGLWAPKGTPEAVLETLRKNIAKAMASADVQSFANDLGAVPGVVSGQAFADKLKSDAQLWEAVAAKVGIDKQ